MTITLYGIPNCDTVRQARAWLQAHGVDYVFHDYKKQGVPVPRLEDWMSAIGWEGLLNRKGTTWRKLDAEQQSAVVDAASARDLMVAQASVIKRPVLEHPDGLLVGFDVSAWERVFG